MITLDHVSKDYQLGKGHTVIAVREVCLEITPGEFLVIVGRSGSGKTTLLNLSAGLTKPTSGHVCLEGSDLWALSDTGRSSLRGQKIGFIFQFPSLLPALTVFENVVLPAVFSAREDPAQVSERAKQLLDRVGLIEKLGAHPRQLSAGQQQRVVIARALMNQPEVILADEPTSNLDEKTELEIMDLFRDLHRTTGITLVVVTHTHQLVPYGTRLIEMSDGRIVNGKETFNVKRMTF